MNIIEIIRKKRDGEKLSTEEIAFLVCGAVDGAINEAQLGAFLMAVYFNGLSHEETTALALEMAHSGEMLDLSSIPGTVDKHSTGGVGDKTTMIVAPLVAAAGVPVAKLSGRALGHTSGTIDRLEAIPGLRTNLTTAELIAQVKKIGLAVGSQTGNLVPADKKLYALRDQTATVEVVSLIAASVMSKKLAGGAEGILLDVKCGQGAFIKDLKQAKELAQIMVEIGKSAGRKMTALITAMEEPLGKAVGEGVETCEAIETLRGSGPADLVDLSLLIASHMACLGSGMGILPMTAGISTTGETPVPQQALALIETLKELLVSGAALEKFRQMVIAQGGDTKVFDNPQSLAQARFEEQFKTCKSGFIQQINAYAIGSIARGLVKNHRGGILLEHKVGEMVGKGEVLARLLSDGSDALKEAMKQIGAAYVIGDEKPEPLPVLLCPPMQ